MIVVEHDNRYIAALHGKRRTVWLAQVPDELVHEPRYLMGARFALACLMTDSADARPDTPAADNIRAIVQLEREAAREATRGERVGQAISNSVGTMTFVACHAVAMVLWMLWNLLAPPAQRFDPYPFGLLTFVVSLEGVLIATFVLITQNQMTRQTDRRDHLSLQISMLAEQEMTMMLKQLRRIAEQLEIPPEGSDSEREAKLAEETNVYELVQTLRRELPEIDRQ
jgi:uncharacterized membrane protein